MDILNMFIELDYCDDVCEYANICPLKRHHNIKVIEALGINCDKLEKMIIDALKLSDVEEVKSLREYLKGNAKSLLWITNIVSKIKKSARSKTVIPPSWGQEIEINDMAISRFFMELTRDVLNGEYDGSGPWEFTIGPFSISEFPYEFFDLVTTREYFEWRPLFGDMGCHIHYRPERDSYTKEWAYAYINSFTLTILLSKLLSHYDRGKTWRFRSRLLEWAKVESFYYNQAKEYIESKNNYWEITLEMYSGREYYHVTLNRNRKSVLTLEMRLAECHTLNAWALLQIINYFTKRKEVPFTVSNFYRLRRFYEKFISYDYLKLNKEIKLSDIGIDSSIIDPNKVITLQKIALLILENVKINKITEEVVKYIYSGKKIVSNKTYAEFIKKVRR